MKQKERSELSDQELLAEAKKMKSRSIANAVMVGFLFGIILYSIFKNTWGLFTLLPLFLAFGLVNRAKRDKKQLEILMKERGLK